MLSDDYNYIKSGRCSQHSSFSKKSMINIWELTLKSMLACAHTNLFNRFQSKETRRVLSNAWPKRQITVLRFWEDSLLLICLSWTLINFMKLLNNLLPFHLTLVINGSMSNALELTIIFLKKLQLLLNFTLWLNSFQLVKFLLRRCSI